MSCDCVCDRCGAPGHKPQQCPHFSRPRLLHPDDWSLFNVRNSELFIAAADPRGSGTGTSSPPPGAAPSPCRRVHKVPGDGDCLFHSVAVGLHSVNITGPCLRARLTSWISQNGHLPLGSATVAQWIAWETGLSLPAYILSLRGGRHGGALEIVILSRIYNIIIDCIHRSTEFRTAPDPLVVA